MRFQIGRVSILPCLHADSHELGEFSKIYEEAEQTGELGKKSEWKIS